VGRRAKQGKGGQELLQVHDLAGDDLGDREPDDLGHGVEAVDDAPHLGGGRPARLGAQPEHELVAVDGVDVEMDATREQPVPASQASTGWLDLRRSSGLKEPMPQWVTLAMSSLAQACNPTNATRSAATMAGSSSWTSGSRCPVNAATAMAWNPG